MNNQSVASRICKFLCVTIALLSSFGLLQLQAQTASNEEKINALIKKMTLEEKIGMIHANSSFTSAGVPRLGIPELVMSDGPHGVRVEHGRGWTRLKNVSDSGTYLPVGIALAATWNPQLGMEYGKVLGSEAAYRGKDVILGPGINIMRSPLNGRNFEYQSEDPYLITKMVVGYIKGVQSQGVSACVKHFAAKNEEQDRNTVDVRMSERALREIYLPGFEAAVQEADVNTVMGSYNLFRGQHATHNAYLINKILKGEWGFKGSVISDWGAVHNRDEALMNGTDLEMGTDLGPVGLNYGKFYLGDTVVTMVRSGKVAESIIDDKVRRLLRVMFKTTMSGKTTLGEYGSPAHIATAKKVAEESIVLLKNEGSLLPLHASKIKSIAVIGVNADRKNAMGGGSSQVNALYEITPLQGLKNAAKNIVFKYVPGYTIERKAKPTAAMISEAVEAAKASDVVVYVGGWTHGYDYSKWNDNAYDAEDTDKPDMFMPFGQDELLKAVLKANPNTVVVLIGGSAVDMTAWIDDTKAVIAAWYGGMEGGNALADVIFGAINPSGKWPVTFAKKLEEVPAHKLGDFPGKNGVAVYNDDIFVSYRYHDTCKVDPQFPFGHGLSYTDFSCKNLNLTKNASGVVTATVTITNTGKVYGGEVAQLYVHKNNSAITRADKELKGFQKVFLKPGESKKVAIQLNKTAFQYYNETKNEWATEEGEYEIQVGRSSKELKLRAPTHIIRQ